MPKGGWSFILHRSVFLALASAGVLAACSVPSLGFRIGPPGAPGAGYSLPSVISRAPQSRISDATSCKGKGAPRNVEISDPNPNDGLTFIRNTTYSSSAGEIGDYDVYAFCPKSKGKPGLKRFTLEFTGKAAKELNAHSKYRLRDLISISAKDYTVNGDSPNYDGFEFIFCTCSGYDGTTYPLPTNQYVAKGPGVV